MSHENARAFGAIMTTLWPLGKSDAETGLLALAALVCEPSDANPPEIAERLIAGVNFVIARGGKRVGAEYRFASWRAACLVSGALTQLIEQRLDVIAAAAKGQLQ